MMSRLGFRPSIQATQAFDTKNDFRDRGGRLITRCLETARVSTVRSDDSTAPIPAECQSFVPTVIIPIQRRLVRVLRTAAPMSCCGRLTVLLAWVSADSESTHGPIHQFSGGS